MNDDDVVPRYLVLVDGRPSECHDSEEDAITEAKSLCRSIEMAQKNKTGGWSAPIEVVRSVRRYELDSETGEMILVGEKLKDQPIRARINGMPVTLTSIEFDPDGTLE